MSYPAPFKPGDRVIYRPSDRGRGLAANDPSAARLVPEHEYIVAEVQQGSYIVIQGHAHPGGGLYWTEFVAAGAV
jgi:hypothetical protein